MLKEGKPPRLFLKEKVIYHQRADALAQTLRLFCLQTITGKKLQKNKKNINNIFKKLIKISI